MRQKFMGLAMSLLLVLVWISFPVPATAATGVIYVDADSGGGKDGTSWANAYNDLQDALDDAQAGDQIWVAEGTYKPGISRTDTFALKEGVEIYGGFDGTETEFSQRNPDPASNGTVLNGDIGTTEDNSDNVYHVVTAGSGLTSSAVLDGFTITAGNADGDGSYSFGAGLHNRGSSGLTLANCNFSGNSAANNGAGMDSHDSSSLTLANCNFSGNSAGSYGGGMYNYASSLTLTGCTFSGNSASKNGGGMINLLGSSLTLTDCTFSDNSATNYGGGIYNEYSDPTLTGCAFSGNSAIIQGGGIYDFCSSPTLTDCTFSGNSAADPGGNPAIDPRGGGMYNRNNSNPTLTNCTFNGNSADYSGGGMINYNNSSPTLTGCTFSDNSAAFWGGGMINFGSSPTLTDCIFSGNSTEDGHGGGMCNYDGSNPTITGSTFSGNSATGFGGGMENEFSSPALTDCTFSDNSATNYGGGMSNYDGSNPTLTDCTFSGNSSNTYGGGMGNDSSSPTLINCIFSDNWAQYGGGVGNYYEESSPEFTNCTFSGNSATTDGGGMYNFDNSSPTLINCILWSNGGTSKSAQIYNNINIEPVVNYCCVQGWTTGGMGNIADDPLFIDAAGGNLRLSVGSPCVDSGTNDGAPTEDIEGNPRPVDGNGDTIAITDMGAYESPFLNNVISVTSTPEGASFTISGAASYSGTTPWSVNETLAGEYTIVWDDLEGYTKPSGETKELADEGSISFEGEYVHITHELTVAVSGNGTTTPSEGVFIYNEGDTVSISATPGEGCEFVNWTGDVSMVADVDAAITTITMNGDYFITANFTLGNYTITFDSVGGSAVSPITQDYDTPVTLPSNPTREGYNFDGWDPEIPSTMPAEDITCVAQWTTNPVYDLTIAVSGSGTTTPSLGPHKYNEGTVVDITATPDPGWQFDNWTGDVADLKSASTTVNIDGDKTVTANFTEVTQGGETGGCCSCSSSDVSANELAIGWGIIGLCWGGGYYIVRSSRRRKI